MADPLDVITTAEAFHAVARDATANATMTTKIEALVTAVSRALDDACGPIVKRDVIDERHPGGGELVILRHRPVAAVTTVKEYTSGVLTTLAAQTDTVSTAADYEADLRLGFVHRRSRWMPARFGTQSVLVTYTAGRYDNTAAVDERFREAAKITLAHLWRAEQGAGSTSFGAFDDRDQQVFEPTGFLIPKRALQLLGRELQPDPVVA